MIDPLITAQRFERSQVARALPARPARRPAHTAKIVTAGVSTSVLLGIVSYLGIAAAQPSNSPVDSVPSPVPTGVPAAGPAVPGVTNPYTPVLIGAAPAVPVPVAIPVVVPVAVPAVPQVISVSVPVAVPPPVAAPQPATPPVVTSGTTSASG